MTIVDLSFPWTAYWGTDRVVNNVLMQTRCLLINCEAAAAWVLQSESLDNVIVWFMTVLLYMTLY